MLKKDIKEIEALAYLLAVCVSLFFLLSLNLLIFNEGFTPDHKFADINIAWPEGFDRMVLGVGTVMVAYNYQQNLFPIFDSLKDKKKEVYLKGSVIGLSFCTVIYTGVTLVGIALFGEYLDSSVLDNFGTILTASGRPFWEAGLIQGLFVILLMFHIPFIFFSGKEAVLIIVDEMDRGSISKMLEAGT